MSDNTAELYKTLTYSNTEFDKQVLFIASGVFGISFAFIDKVVKLQEASHKCLLIWSWYILGGTIFLSLLAHFISIMANRWAIKNCPPADNEDEKREAHYCKKEKYWNITIRAINLIMITSLLLGIIFFVNFINYNI